MWISNPTSSFSFVRKKSHRVKDTQRSFIQIIGGLVGVNNDGRVE